MKLPWFNIFTSIPGVLAALFLEKLVDWFIPDQWRLSTLVIGWIVVLALIASPWVYAWLTKEARALREELVLERSRSKQREEISRKAQQLAKVMIEAMAKIMVSPAGGAAPKWLNTEEAKVEERGAKHEIWICTADLEPDTTAFLVDPILRNLDDKKRYRYIFDETEIKRFKTLQDNARRVYNVIGDRRLEGKCSPHELSNIQLVILDAQYTKGSYKKVYLHFPFLTHSAAKNTVEIDDLQRVDELVHLFETFWESLPEVPWE